MHRRVLAPQKTQVYILAVMVINGKEYSVTDLMRPAVSIPITATLGTVLEAMISGKRNSLVVVNEDDTFAGAVNAIDVIRAVLPDYLEEDQIAARFGDFELLKEDAQKATTMTVDAFMTKNAATIKDDGSLLEAAVMAAAQGSGRIVVLNAEQKPVGVLTRTEIKQVIGQALGLSGDLFQ